MFPASNLKICWQRKELLPSSDLEVIGLIQKSDPCEDQDRKKTFKDQNGEAGGNQQRVSLS